MQRNRAKCSRPETVSPIIAYHKLANEIPNGWPHIGWMAVGWHTSQFLRVPYCR